MHTNNRKPAAQSIDLTELVSSKPTGKNSFTERNQGRVLEYYLVDEVQSADEYVEWFDEIRHASLNDVVKIYINSPGGDLFTAIQFMRVLRECQGAVIGSVDGACMSAATVIFLACDAYEVSPHSNFMFHNYSGFAVGKGGEMKDQMAFESKWSEALMKDVYADFLTLSELSSMLEGKDLWMTADQVVDRLNKRQKARKAKAKSS